LISTKGVLLQKARVEASHKGDLTDRARQADRPARSRFNAAQVWTAASKRQWDPYGSPQPRWSINQQTMPIS